ncbi:MarR family winged helix-turn-helix transcriptional regulator [Bacillus horti]|uniref:HTH-type transcriptional regulator SarZ n=1 Tax=Caldalkalibacillus horti TaxID=77523 RepID=A0ABT9VY09_9BACI|nr:MarR family transcriptional regulator [Bacillus horti]MDQ0165867.1 DNA-binding MarR family transcriptional regulator [Bacillus horti]
MENREELITEIDLLTIQMNKRFKQAMTELFKGELTLTEYIFLKYLLNNGPSRPSDAAAVFEVSLAHVTSMCDRLVKKSLIYRERTEADRRTIEIGLSEEGKAIIEKFTKIKREFLTTLYQDLSDEELTQLIFIMKKVNDSFEKR